MNTLLMLAVLTCTASSAAGPGDNAAAGGTRVLQDVPYANDDNPRHRLNLFIPKSSEKLLPLVVFIHGGAWQSGSYKSGAEILRPLVESGDYAGASIGYRLTDEARWPAQIHDCKAAIRFLRSNAAKWNINPERIAVIGPSAGGHLASMLGTSGGVQSMMGEVGDCTETDDRITCVVDLFGPSDLLQMDRQAPEGARLIHDAPNSPESRLLGAPLQSVPARAQTANPITYITADDPPFLILHGTNDAIVPYGQSVLLHEALQAAKVNSIFIPIQGAGHGGPPFAREHGRIRLFLDQHLHGMDVQADARITNKSQKESRVEDSSPPSREP
jgi:acetyl esterase/lipase